MTNIKDCNISWRDLGPLWEGSPRLRLHHCRSLCRHCSAKPEEPVKPDFSSFTGSSGKAGAFRLRVTVPHSAAQCRGTVSRSRSRPSRALPKGPLVGSCKILHNNGCKCNGWSPLPRPPLRRMRASVSRLCALSAAPSCQLVCCLVPSILQRHH